MAISFDASSSGYGGASGSFSFSHITGAGASAMLVATDTEITGVTYAGVSLSLLTSYTPVFPSGTNCRPLKIWYLQNPTVGTNTVFITVSGGSSKTACAVTYIATNEVQPNIQSNEDSANNQVATWSPSVTPTITNCWVVSFAISQSGLSRKFSAGASTTMRVNNTLTGGSNIGIFDSNTTVSSGVSSSLNINVLNASDNQSSDFVTTITIALAPPTEISVSDSVSISESVNMEKYYDLSVSDSISITESVNSEQTLDIIVSDSLTISESYTVENAQLGGISVSEAVSVTEFVDGDYYPSILNGFQEMSSKEDNWPLGMDDETML